jgi:hypothetical protein
VYAVAVGVGNASFSRLTKCPRSGTAKHAPKKAAHADSAINCGTSWDGESDMSCNTYIAGTADTKMMPVALVKILLVS